jgi:hypothetical protein
MTETRWTSGDIVELRQGDTWRPAVVWHNSDGSTHHGRGIYIRRSIDYPDGTSRVGPHWVALDRVRAVA